MDKRTIIFIIVLAASFYVMQLIFPPPKAPAPVKAEKEIEKVVKEDFRKKPIVQPTAKESFYVLENDFLQVVFSTKGGSITEINLPFKTKENQKSIVNEINFDREMKSQSLDNAKFPLNSYQIYKDGKIVEQKPSISGYYPLLRRHLVGHPSISPSYYSLNIVSDADGIENANYKLTRLEKDLIEFELTVSNRRVIKTYQFAKDAPYTFDIGISVEGDNKNLWLTSGVPEVELTSGRSSPVLKLRTYRKQKNVVDQLSLPKGITTVSSIYPDWICNSNGFLGLIIDPLTEIPPGYRTKYIAGNSLPTRLTQIDQRYNLYPADKYPGYEMFLPLKSNGEKTNFRIFAGPFAKNILNAVDATYSNAITGYNPEYIKAKSFHGIFAFISEPFAKLMFSLMQLFHKTTASWGLSIILLTFVLRLMLYPLNAWSIKANTKMQEFAPKIKEIQKRYANNPQKQKMEMMKLYKEKGSNPLMGCFPVFIQIPFLLGMFDLLKSTFELRGASFIPGWINNLTAPDVVFSWGRPIPLVGTEFHLLPIIMGIVMYVQSKYMTKKPVKTTGVVTDQERQQKALSTLMPIIFTVIFYKMPSGLNIYYLFFSLFGILQQWIMNRKTKKTLIKT